MPPVVVAIATYVASAIGIGALSVGASIAVTDAIYAGVFYLTQAAIYYGISKALTPKTKLGSIRSASSQIMVQGTAESHRIIYGQSQTSGIFYPLGTSGANGEYLHFLLVYAAHECNSFGTLNVAGEAVSLDGSGNVTTGKWAGLMRVKSHLGAWNQTVDADLQSELGGTFWPSTARLRGRAYDYFRIKADVNVSAGSVPALTRMVQGRKVYDVRDGAQDPNDPATWVYSANWALCVADWIAGVPMRNGAGNVVRNYGFRAAYSEISSADWIEAANICDEAVALVAGGTEVRYACNGIVQTTASRGDVLDAMRTAAVGDVMQIGDKWIIRAAAYRTPTVTLTEDDFRAPITSLQVKASRRDLCNGVKGTFTSPENNWSAADFPAYTKEIPVANLMAGDEVMIVEAGTTTWTSIGAANNNVGTIFTATGPGTGTGFAEAYIVEDGGDRLWLDIELPFTTSGATAQRIAKIILERNRQSITYTARLKLTALQNQPTDVVGQTFTRYGWSAKPFRVENFQPVNESGPGGEPLLGCDLMLRETAAAVYNWGLGDESAHDLAPNTTLPNPFSVPAASGLTLLSDDTTGITQPDGTVVPRLLASWNQPADINVISGGFTDVEYKKHIDVNWLAWSSPKGDITSDFITDVHAGVVYDVRIRHRSARGVVGAYDTVTSYTIPGKAAQPATPTNITASRDGVKPGYDPSSKIFLFGTRVSFTASPDPDILEYEIKATITDSDGATDYSWTPYDGVNDTLITKDLFGFLYTAGLFAGFIRVRSFNTSGVASNWGAANGGGAPSNATNNASFGSGGIAKYNEDGVETEGIQTGILGSSSVRQVITIYDEFAPFTLAGGATFEDINVDLTGRGFTTRPDVGHTVISEVPGLIAASYMQSLSISTNAVIRIFTTDGTALPGGMSGYVSAQFKEYT